MEILKELDWTGLQQHYVQYRSPTEIYWKIHWKLLNNCYQYLSDSLVKPDIEFKKNKWVQ